MGLVPSLSKVAFSSRKFETSSGLVNWTKAEVSSKAWTETIDSAPKAFQKHSLICFTFSFEDSPHNSIMLENDNVVYLRLDAAEPKESVLLFPVFISIISPFTQLRYKWLIHFWSFSFCWKPGVCELKSIPKRKHAPENTHPVMKASYPASCLAPEFQFENLHKYLTC